MPFLRVGNRNLADQKEPELLGKPTPKPSILNGLEPDIAAGTLHPIKICPGRSIGRNYQRVMDARSSVNTIVPLRKTVTVPVDWLTQMATA